MVSFVNVYFAQFLCIAGVGLLFPVLPYMAKAFDATPLEVGMLTAGYVIPQCIMQPIWGMLSDKVGRYQVLIGCLFCQSIALCALGLSQNISALLLCRAFHGAFSGVSGVLQMIICDSVAPEGRVETLAHFGVASGLGFVIGPGIGGLLAPYGYDTIAFVVAFLSLVNCILAAINAFKLRSPSGYTFLKSPVDDGVNDAGATGVGRVSSEVARTLSRQITSPLDKSLTEETSRILRRASSIGIACGAQASVNDGSKADTLNSPRSKQTFWSVSEQLVDVVRGHPKLVGLCSVRFLWVCSWEVFVSLSGLWLFEAYGVSARQFGALLFTGGSAMIACMLLLSGPCIKRLGEPLATLTGTLLRMAAFIFLLSVRASWAPYLAITVMVCADSLTDPSLDSMLAAQAGEGSRGLVMGLGQASSMAGGFVGPVAGGELYGFGRDLPAYFSLCLMTVSCSLISCLMDVRPTPRAPLCDPHEAEAGHGTRT